MYLNFVIKNDTSVQKILNNSNNLKFFTPIAQIDLNRSKIVNLSLTQSAVPNFEVFSPKVERSENKLLDSLDNLHLMSPHKQGVINISERKNSTKLLRAGSDEHKAIKKIDNSKRSPYAKQSSVSVIKDKEKRLNVIATKVEKTNKIKENLFNSSVTEKVANSAGIRSENYSSHKTSVNSSKVGKGQKFK